MLGLKLALLKSLTLSASRVTVTHLKIGSRWWNLWVPYLQMTCGDLTNLKGWQNVMEPHYNTLYYNTILCIMWRWQVPDIYQPDYQISKDTPYLDDEPWNVVFVTLYFLGKKSCYKKVPCALPFRQLSEKHADIGVQIMACRLFGTKPLSEPMLPYCQLTPGEYISVNFF